jgi:hypothetical protein
MTQIKISMDNEDLDMVHISTPFNNNVEKIYDILILLQNKIEDLNKKVGEIQNELKEHNERYSNMMIRNQSTLSRAKLLHLRSCGSFHVFISSSLPLR